MLNLLLLDEPRLRPPRKGAGDARAPRRARLASMAAAAWLVTALARCAPVTAGTDGAALPDDAVPSDLRGGDSSSALAVDAARDAAPPSCQGAPADHPDGGVCLLEVRATVLDENAAPVPDLLVSVCAGECFYGRTAADGSVVVAIDTWLDPTAYSFIPHARPTWATYYAPLPPVEPAPGGASLARFVAPLRLARLPATGPLIATDGSAQTLRSGEVTLVVPAGTTVSPSIEDTIDGKPITFRALRVPPALYPPFVDAQHLPAAVYAISPYEADLTGGKALLRFDNATHLAAASAVDVLGLGSILWAEGPAPGHLGVIAGAHVSADGATIDLDAPTIRFLTWVALRPKGP